MEFDAFGEGRRFRVGLADVELNHVANISLRADEMVTFVDSNKREYDVTAKNWGYYATPSVGKRLREFGMRAALMRNMVTGHAFVVLVFDDQVEAWRDYMAAEKQELVTWLDEV